MGNTIVEATSLLALKNEVVDGEEVIEEEDVEKLGHDNQDLASSSPSSSTISVTRHVDILRLLLNSVPLFCEWMNYLPFGTVDK